MKLRTKLLLFPRSLSLLAACDNSPKSQKLIPRPDDTREGYSEKPKDFTVFNPKVDILF